MLFVESQKSHVFYLSEEINEEFNSISRLSTAR